MIRRKYFKDLIHTKAALESIPTGSWENLARVRKRCHQAE